MSHHQRRAMGVVPWNFASEQAMQAPARTRHLISPSTNLAILTPTVVERVGMSGSRHSYHRGRLSFYLHQMASITLPANQSDQKVLFISKKILALQT